MKKKYRNYFNEIGICQEAIDTRLKQIFNQLFYGEDAIYHQIGDEMAYIEDTGNHDARTEGMSYGMMMCVQTNHKKEFDCLWNFAKTYMYMNDGENSGYFAWSVSPDGRKNSYGPAPDGEEFFAMALFFASHRWGEGDGIYAYEREAKELLHTCIHKGENGAGRAMWDPDNYLIRFIPDRDFTDPSYHLPHFYELFAKWAYEEDREFWKKAAEASREFLKKACHPITGLSAEYSTYDGAPYSDEQVIFGRHDWYYSDAYRTIANIALDYEWFMKEKDGGWHKDTAEKLQRFFGSTVKENDRAVYLIDGTVLQEKALHPVAMTAVNAQASLASEGEYAAEFVRKLWETPLREGERRYYDNCLYFFAFLALSGNYRMY